MTAFINVCSYIFFSVITIMKPKTYIDLLPIEIIEYIYWFVYQDNIAKIKYSLNMLFTCADCRDMIYASVTDPELSIHYKQQQALFIGEFTRNHIASGIVTNPLFLTNIKNSNVFSAIINRKYNWGVSDYSFITIYPLFRNYENVRTHIQELCNGRLEYINEKYIYLKNKSYDELQSILIRNGLTLISGMNRFDMIRYYFTGVPFKAIGAIEFK